MKNEYNLCKERLTELLEKKETIPFIRGKELDVDSIIKEELDKKFPKYLINLGDNKKRYSRLAEKGLIEFCEKGKIFETSKGEKYKLRERFSVEKYRYFVSEGLD